MKKRITALCTALVLLICLLPLQVFAHASPSGSAFGINPALSYTVPRPNRNHHTFQNLNDTPVFLEDPALVSAAMRDGMDLRQDVVTVYYRTDHYLSNSEFLDLFNGAFAVTRVPTQGDYLRETWQTYDAYWDCTEDSGFCDYTITVYMTYETTLEQEQALAEEAARVLTSFGFTDATTDYAKIRTIYDYLCSNIVYDYEHVSDGSYLLQYTAYAALLQGTAVCEGYAKAFYYLGLLSGLTPRIVTGFSNGETHAWNIVRLDGLYYNLDATWDAEETEYLYFLKGSSDFQGHTRRPQFNTEGYHALHPMADSAYIHTFCDTHSFVNGYCEFCGKAENNSFTNPVYNLNNPEEYQALILAIREAMPDAFAGKPVPALRYIMDSPRRLDNLYDDVSPSADVNYVSEIVDELGIFHYSYGPPAPSTDYWTGEISFSPHFTKEKIEAFYTKVDAVVASFGFTDSTSDYEKIKTIYTFICDNVAYDYTFSHEHSASSYGALMEGVAVCAGYAALFQRLATEAGLDSRIIGTQTPAGPHAWNIVKLGNLYYQLDATWDDGLGYAPDEYQWFLRGTSDFPEHAIEWVYQSDEFRAAYPIAETGYHTIPAHEHRWLTIYTNEATCETHGYSEEMYCDICHLVEKHGSDLLPTGHDYQPVDSKEPTCTEAGYINYVCRTDSSHVYSAAILPLNHLDINRDSVCDTCGETTQCTHPMLAPANSYQEPTCTMDGESQPTTCYWCTWVLVPGEKVPAFGHDYVIKNITEADCTHDGQIIYVCSHDNWHRKSEFTPATGHTDKNHDDLCDTCGKTYSCFHEGEYLPEVPPTCTESGLTYGLICSKCGEWMTTRDEIPALGHSFANGICTVCGEEEASEPMENPFVDVKESDYFYNPVLWALQNKVTTGTSPTTFGPDNPCTRGQTVMFLWRAAGSPAPTLTENPFEDVKESDYFYTAVLWAVEQGITKGTSATAFSPDAPCTRGQIATFLYSSQGKPITEGDNVFSDVSESDYYYTPILWAAQNNVTGGIGNGMFGPNQTCTRAHIVTFLYKIYG